MLLVPVRALKPGMRLVQPITHPRRDDFILLEKGCALTETIIGRLAALGLHEVWIKFPRLRARNAAIHKRLRGRHGGLYRTLVRSIGRVRSRVAVGSNLGHYLRSVEGLLFEILADPDYDAVIAPLSHMPFDPAGHAANVAYLSLLLGFNLNAYLRIQRRNLPSHLAESTQGLGIGGLLHDIGKLDLDPSMRGTNILDAEAVSDEYRAHTTLGYERVLGAIPAAAANVVLNHHQRYDGRGFPERFDRLTKSTREPPAGDRIHIFSRIAAVADAFDRLLIAGGPKQPTIVTLHALRSERFAGWFDPIVVDALVRLVPPFAVGSIVTLNNGADAMVMTNHLSVPCEPIIKLVRGPITERGPHLFQGEIDLRRHPGLAVASVAGVPVTPYLFHHGEVPVLA
jgi:hypothetical protein